MAGPLQIILRFFFIVCLMGSFFSAQEKWNYSAQEMDQIKVNEQTIRRLKNKVRFSKTDQIILTDNAVVCYNFGNKMCHIKLNVGR